MIVLLQGGEYVYPFLGCMNVTRFEFTETACIFSAYGKVPCGGYIISDFVIRIGKSWDVCGGTYAWIIVRYSPCKIAQGPNRVLDNSRGRIDAMTDKNVVEIVPNALFGISIEREIRNFVIVLINIRKNVSMIIKMSEWFINRNIRAYKCVMCPTDVHSMRLICYRLFGVRTEQSVLAP